MQNLFFEIDDFPVAGSAFASQYLRRSMIEVDPWSSEGTGKITITRQGDEYSNSFFNVCASGQQLKRVAIVSERLKDDDSGSLVARNVLTLRNSLIDSIYVMGPGVEEITFFYEKLEKKVQGDKA
jgi:type VI protein secretion system component Hcp